MTSGTLIQRILKPKGKVESTDILCSKASGEPLGVSDLLDPILEPAYPTRNGRGLDPQRVSDELEMSLQE